MIQVLHSKKESVPNTWCFQYVCRLSTNMKIIIKVAKDLREKTLKLYTK